MKFSEYMSEWLYGEGGYYRSVGQVGKAGDFLTSPTISPFFGGALANKFLSLFRSGEMPKDAVICEFGANSLYAIKDFASFLMSFEPSLLSSLKFVIVERQPEVRAFQQRELNEFFEGLDFEIVDTLFGYEDKTSFVFANEIFDSFPCELYFEGKIASIHGGSVFFDTEDRRAEEFAQKYSFTKGEIALGYEEFAHSLYSAFRRSYFVTFDYGQEFARGDFSVRIYKEHKTEPLFEVKNLDLYFKSADITYDVNFAHLKDAFEGAGFKFLEYKKQGVALVDFGVIELLDMLSQCVDRDRYLKEAAKVKLLIAPEGLGERFKMISFSKEIG